MTWIITIEHGDKLLGTVEMDEFPYGGLQSVLLDYLEEYDDGYYMVSSKTTDPREIGPTMLSRYRGMRS